MKLIKTILLLFALTVISPLARGQDFAGIVGTPLTLTNSQADTTLVTITRSRPAITFKYDITKTSGTIAGTIVLQARVTNLVGEQWTTVNTYTLTNATATSSVLLTANQYVYYRVIATTTGTSVCTHSLYLLYRGYYPLQ